MDLIDNIWVLIMFLCNHMLDNMGNFNNYVCDKYILDDNKFVRNRKLPQECIMRYVPWNRGRTTALEALYFMEEFWGDMDMDVSKQAISERRMIIDPQAYVDINDDLITKCFTDEIVALCKELCGAVAISWYRQKHTYRAIQMLLDAGIKTNIHYVLGNNSIDEAIERLKNNDFPKGVNAIIFLLHKPVGLGQESNVLNME